MNEQTKMCPPPAEGGECLRPVLFRLGRLSIETVSAMIATIAVIAVTATIAVIATISVIATSVDAVNKRCAVHRKRREIIKCKDNNIQLSSCTEWAEGGLRGLGNGG